MAEVTGLTAAAMQAIADSMIVSGSVDGSGHLILTKQDSSTVDAGDVIGPTGATGATGPTAPAPTGAVMMFASATPPTGWLLCDGSAVSRTTYSDLFALVGTSYGPGNGSTTFNVPNFTDRFPRHHTDAMGSSGGASTHPHTHSIADHSHSLANGNPPAFAKMTLNSGKVYEQKINGVNSWQSDTNNDTGGTNNANTGGLTSGAMLGGNTNKQGSGNTGSDSTSTLPPYLNIAFIIKT
jgi:microcystin-dependent protein